MDVKMSVIQDGDYEKIWMSKVQNQGEFNFFYLFVLEYLDEIMGEEAPAKYNISIRVISPELNEEKCRNELKSVSGIDYDEASDESKVMALNNYGIFATVFSEAGNNKAKLVKQAVGELNTINFIKFGYAMDKAQNRIGSTGWDFVRGDIMAGLNK